jgi:hypothetical protein
MYDAVFAIGMEQTIRFGIIVDADIKGAVEGVITSGRDAENINRLYLELITVYV